MMDAIWMSGRAVKLFDGVGGPQTSNLYPVNDLTRQLDFGPCWETCVCSQLRLTDDRGTHAEKKGPLQYVNSAKVGEEKQGWGNPGNETVLRSVLDASVPVGRELTRTYFSRTNEQTIPKTLNPIRMACVLRIL